MSKPAAPRNPILIGAIVAIAVLVVVLLVSGFLLFNYLGSYQQRVSAPAATVAALLATPIEPPTPEGYNAEVTPLATPLPNKPVRALRDVTLRVAPYDDAPELMATDGTKVMLAQGIGATATAINDRLWQRLRLADGSEGWVPPDAVE